MSNVNKGIIRQRRSMDEREVLPINIRNHHYVGPIQKCTKKEQEKFLNDSMDIEYKELLTKKPLKRMNIVNFIKQEAEKINELDDL